MEDEKRRRGRRPRACMARWRRGKDMDKGEWWDGRDEGKWWHADEWNRYGEDEKWKHGGISWEAGRDESWKAAGNGTWHDKGGSSNGKLRDGESKQSNFEGDPKDQDHFSYDQVIESESDMDDSAEEALQGFIETRPHCSYMHQLMTPASLQIQQHLSYDQAIESASDMPD